MFQVLGRGVKMEKYKNKDSEEKFARIREYVEFLVNDLIIFSVGKDELSDEAIERWAKGIGEDIKNPLVEVAIKAVKEQLERKERQ